MIDEAKTSAQTSITVAAVQTPLRFHASADSFRADVRAVTEQAMRREPDLIVFPEDIGTGLVALGTPSACRASSLRKALAAIMLRNIVPALPRLLRPSIPLPRALLLTLARRMREVYVSTFSDLAARCGVFIAAGTALLPPDAADTGEVRNRFFLFGPDGEIRHIADKVNLIDLEADGGLHLSPGSREELSVWPTEIGCFAPVICYDAWDRALVRDLVDQGAQMLLVPAANPEPWTGRVEAERGEGMYSRVREQGVPGVEAFAVGKLAGLEFEGRSWVVAPDAHQPDGVRVLAQAETATEAEVISASVSLPEPRSACASGDQM
jgi:predicted amidohydrolase